MVKSKSCVQSLSRFQSNLRVISRAFPSILSFPRIWLAGRLASAGRLFELVPLPAAALLPSQEFTSYCTLTGLLELFTPILFLSCQVSGHCNLFVLPFFTSSFLNAMFTLLWNDTANCIQKRSNAVRCEGAVDRRLHSWAIKKPHELRVACGQDVILIFLVSTFSSASFGKYDTSGISSFIPGIQGHMCFLVMVSEENCFFFGGVWQSVRKEPFQTRLVCRKIYTCIYIYQRQFYFCYF